MLSKKNKDKINGFFFKLGEKVGKQLKAKEIIDKINSFGNKKPKSFFGWLLVLLITSFIINIFLKDLLISSNNTDIKSINEEIVSETYQEEKTKLKKEVESIYLEMKILSDSINKTLKKEQLTQEDSIFVIEGYYKLENLDKVLNQNFNKNEEN